MFVPSPRPVAVLLGIAATLAMTAPARAQMTPITDIRQLTANMTYAGVSAHQTKTPPGFFADWEEFATAVVDDPDRGLATSEAYQITSFFPAGLYYAGNTSGSYNLVPGAYDATSSLDWTVQTNACLSYTLHAEVDPGDGGTHYVRMSSDGIKIVDITDGALDRTGQMPAGTYRFEGMSSFASTAQYFTGGAYSLIIFCSACSGTLIPPGQPRDTVVECNQAAQFCVTPAASGGPFTYQWYNASGPLPENGHFVGTTTPCLTIQHACFVDVGTYAVVVTSTSTQIVENSKPAHLGTTSGPVGVEPGAVAFKLGAATPNPFARATVLRYESPAPFFAHVAVYDASGRLVQRLADRVLDTSGTLTWDGRTTSGAPAVPGIYFVRVERDGHVETRRLALVR